MTFMGEAEAWELEALEDDEAEEEHALKASAAAAVMANTVCEREKLMIIIIREGDNDCQKRACPVELRTTRSGVKAKSWCCCGFWD